MVALIVIIMAAIALPNFYRGKEHALGREAVGSLRFIHAAEQSYRMENGTYYPNPGAVQNGLVAINSNLKLSLNNLNWNFSIDTTVGGGPASDFLATATRGAGGIACTYTIDEGENFVKGGTCP